MKNEQPIETQISDDVHLDVIKIWDTIQGEGPYAGRPATFLRLAGCNLLCPLCDTDYTTGRVLHTIPDLVGQIPIDRKLIVLTGGEPFRQQIESLCFALLERGHLVQIETNGTLFLTPRIRLERWTWDRVSIVCSPKTSKLHPGILPFIDAYKYVVAYGEIDVMDGLPKSVLGREGRPARPHDKNIPVYVQPCDEKDGTANERNRTTALEVARRYDYILSLQQHKLLGLE